MHEAIRFNRVSFGVPVETFDISAYIALEERLPVVTEYVLRMVHVCAKVSSSAMREFFGFSQAEALAVVEALCRQGLLVADGENLQLSSFASERFSEAGGGYPRFSKVELKRDTVTFDLITFTPLQAVGGALPSDNLVKLDAPEDAIGRSIEKARLAYRQKYDQIAFRREDLRERSFGVYSIEDIESKRRNYVPISVNFSLDAQGQVHREFDEEFERVAPPALITAVSEQVTKGLPTTLSLLSSSFQEFLDAFDAKFLEQYLVGKKFELARYVHDAFGARCVKTPRGVEPLFGNLYLSHNSERLVTRVTDRLEGKRRSGKLLTSLVWLIPDYELWGRGDAFSTTVQRLTSVLTAQRDEQDLFLCAHAEAGGENPVKDQFRVHQLRELHFLRAGVGKGKLMDGRLEIALMPTGVAFVLYHLSIPSNPGLWAPVGFVSRAPKHLETAHKLITLAMGGKGYGGRARFSQKDTRSAPTTFADAMPFLNFSSLRATALEELDDVEDLPLGPK